MNGPAYKILVLNASKSRKGSGKPAYMQTFQSTSTSHTHIIIDDKNFRPNTLISCPTEYVIMKD